MDCVWKLMKEMFWKGFYFDVFLFNIIMDVLGKVNKLDVVCEVFVCMVELGCKFDLIFYNIFIDSYVRFGDVV